MTFQQYFATYRGAMQENRFHRTAHLVQLAAILVLALLLITRDHTVVVVPPGLEGEAQLTRKSASENLMTAWGLHVATLLGNVTPSTSAFLGNSIGPMLAPSIYRRVLDAIDAQVKHIQEEQVTLTFAPTEAKFDAAGDVVYVTGELITRGVRGTEERELRTYEMQFTVADHRVLLADIRVYRGRPTDQPPAS